MGWDYRIFRPVHLVFPESKKTGTGEFDFLFFVVLCRNFYQLCVIGSFKKYHFVRNYMEYVMGVCY